MSGVDLARTRKCIRYDRLLFTAYADLDAVIAAINEGNVYRYISKPWEVQELKAVLKQSYEFYLLQEERRKLLKEVQSKNALLATTNLELHRANEMKKAFIKVASHELRTPLTILLGLSEHAVRLTNRPRERPHGTHPPLGLAIATRRSNGGFSWRAARATVAATSGGSRQLDPSATRNQSFYRKHINTSTYRSDDLGIIQSRTRPDCLTQLLINTVRFTPDSAPSASPPFAARKLPRHHLRHRQGIGGKRVRVFDPFFTAFGVVPFVRHPNTTSAASASSEHGQGVHRNAAAPSQSPADSARARRSRCVGRIARPRCPSADGHLESRNPAFYEVFKAGAHLRAGEGRFVQFDDKNVGTSFRWHSHRCIGAVLTVQDSTALGVSEI